MRWQYVKHPQYRKNFYATMMQCIRVYIVSRGLPKMLREIIARFSFYSKLHIILLPFTRYFSRTLVDNQICETAI